MSNTDDQDALAAAWAAQLEEEEAAAGADPFEQAQAAAENAGSNAGVDAGADTGTDAGADALAMAAEAAPAPVEAAPPSKDEDLAARWAESLAEDEGAAAQSVLQKKSLSSQPSEAVFKDMTDIARRPSVDGAKRELDFILDIPLDVSVELGRTRLLINELLQLGQGSVVELNKLAGEPLEVYVNGKLVARGEAVVINEKFGVRLTDIISPMERVKQLA